MNQVAVTYYSAISKTSGRVYGYEDKITKLTAPPISKRDHGFGGSQNNPKKYKYDNEMSSFTLDKISDPYSKPAPTTSMPTIYSTQQILPANVKAFIAGGINDTAIVLDNAFTQWAGRLPTWQQVIYDSPLMRNIRQVSGYNAVSNVMRDIRAGFDWRNLKINGVHASDVGEVTSYDSQLIFMVDRQSGKLMAYARPQGDFPGAFLSDTQLYDIPDISERIQVQLMSDEKYIELTEGEEKYVEDALEYPGFRNVGGYEEAEAQSLWNAVRTKVGQLRSGVTNLLNKGATSDNAALLEPFLGADASEFAAEQLIPAGENFLGTVGANAGEYAAEFNEAAFGLIEDAAGVGGAIGGVEIGVARAGGGALNAAAEAFAPGIGEIAVTAGADLLAPAVGSAIGNVVGGQIGRELGLASGLGEFVGGYVGGAIGSGAVESIASAAGSLYGPTAARAGADIGRRYLTPLAMGGLGANVAPTVRYAEMAGIRQLVGRGGTALARILGRLAGPLAGVAAAGLIVKQLYDNYINPTEESKFKKVHKYAVPFGKDTSDVSAPFLGGSSFESALTRPGDVGFALDSDKNFSKWLNGIEKRQNELDPSLKHPLLAEYYYDKPIIDYGETRDSISIGNFSLSGGDVKKFFGVGGKDVSQKYYSDQKNLITLSYDTYMRAKKLGATDYLLYAYKIDPKTIPRVSAEKVLDSIRTGVDPGIVSIKADEKLVLSKKDIKILSAFSYVSFDKNQLFEGTESFAVLPWDRLRTINGSQFLDMLRKGESLDKYKLDENSQLALSDEDISKLSNFQGYKENQLFRSDSSYEVLDYSKAPVISAEEFLKKVKNKENLFYQYEGDLALTKEDLDYLKTSHYDTPNTIYESQTSYVIPNYDLLPSMSVSDFFKYLDMGYIPDARVSGIVNLTAGDIKRIVDVGYVGLTPEQVQVY
jgi:hypothetical protein